MIRPHTTVEYPWAPVPEALLLDQSIGGQAVRLYAIVMRHGQDSRSCYPSKRRLAGLMGMSESQVWRLVKELVEAGWMAVVERRGEDGGQLSNGFDVFASPRARAAAVRGGEGRAPRDPKESQTSKETDPSLRSGSPARRDGAMALALPGTTFDDFWKLWPGRRVKRPKAEAAFKAACKRVGPEKVMDGVRRLAADPNLPPPKFIPYPTTWLNADGWTDDPYAPRTDERRATPVEHTMRNFAHLFAEGDPDGESESRGGGAGAIERRAPGPGR